MSLDPAVATEVLAAEHAAVYGYGVLAGVFTATPRRQALDGLDTHRARRDDLRRLILAAGGTPVEAQAAYALPEPLSGPGPALTLAAQIEADLAVAYGALVAASTGAARAFAAAALQDAAVRVSTWSGEAPQLPGIAAVVATSGPLATRLRRRRSPLT
ncbi:MAG: DUF4439 domain-containing protein [Sporichthyaceae bacterium]